MALSMDLRKRIVDAYENKEGSIRELAKRFKVTFATVFRLLKKQRIWGALQPKSPPGRPSKITEEGLKYIEKLIKKDEDITLKELCKAYREELKVKVSLMAMHRACRRLEMRYKKNAVCT